jgi:hypothetical protein
MSTTKLPAGFMLTMKSIGSPAATLVLEAYLDCGGTDLPVKRIGDHRWLVVELRVLELPPGVPWFAFSSEVRAALLAGDVPEKGRPAVRLAVAAAARSKRLRLKRWCPTMLCLLI